MSQGAKWPFTPKLYTPGDRREVILRFQMNQHTYMDPKSIMFRNILLEEFNTKWILQSIYYSKNDVRRIVILKKTEVDFTVSKQ